MLKLYYYSAENDKRGITMPACEFRAETTLELMGRLNDAILRWDLERYNHERVYLLTGFCVHCAMVQNPQSFELTDIETGEEIGRVYVVNWVPEVIREPAASERKPQE